MKITEAGACFLNTNSAVRNTTLAIGACKTLPLGANLMVGASSVAAAVVGLPLALSIAKDGCKKMVSSARVRDLEGVVQNGLWCGVGAGYAGLSGLLGINGFFALQSKAAPAFVTPAFGYGAVGMYAPLLAYGLHGYWKSLQFHKEFEAEVKEGGNEKAITWLKEQITLSKDELETYKDLAEQEKLLKKKRERFERRAGASCLAHVEQKQNLELTEKEASDLILEVRKSCFKKRVEYFLLILLAILGLAASICVLVSSGPASSLLFGIGALSWFTVDSSKLHDAIGERLWIWINKSKNQSNLDFNTAS